MVFYTYYCRADLRTNGEPVLVNIILWNSHGKVILKAPDLGAKYGGEATIFLLGKEIKISLVSGEAQYIISEERHHPQDAVETMYERLTR